MNRPPFSRPASPQQLAERALRRPSSALWLNHVSVTTRRFDESLAFYVSTLGLSLRTVELDPASPTRLCAVLVDAEDRDVLEIVQADDEAEAPGTNVGRLAFSLPRRAWLLLRVRLEAQDYPYRLTNECIFVEDADGLLLRVSPLGEC
ncbi:MAG: VOC family protein [Rubricoccaceae bacterium]|nr:VOC family protein [Rubricoccaceae bacterium]